VYVLLLLLLLFMALQHCCWLTHPATYTALLPRASASNCHCVRESLTARVCFQETGQMPPSYILCTNATVLWDVMPDFKHAHVASDD